MIIPKPYHRYLPMVTFILLFGLLEGCNTADVGSLKEILVEDCGCSPELETEEIIDTLQGLKLKARKREMDPIKGLACANKLIAEAGKNNLDVEVQYLLQKLKYDFGIYSRTEEGLVQVEEAAEEMLSLAESSGSQKFLANAYHRLQTLSAIKNNAGEVSPEEMHYLLRAKLAAEASGDTLETLTNLQHAQTLSMKIMDEDELVDLSQKTLKIAGKTTNPDYLMFLVFAHKHLGYHYYAFEDNYELSEEHLLKAYDLAQKHLAPVHVAIVARDLIALYATHEKPEKMALYQKDVPSPDGLPFNDAYVAYGFGDYDKAHVLIRPMLEAKEMKGNKGLILRFHAADMLYLINKSKGAYKEAMEFAELKNSLQDSLNRISLKGQMEFLLQEEQIRQQEASLEEKDEYISQLMLALVIFAVQLGLVCWLMLKLNKKRRQLEEKNHIIDDQNEELIAVNQNLESFASVASHDLRSPLRNIYFYSEILERELDDLEGSTREYMEIIRSSVENLDQLLDDILAYSRAAEKIDVFQPVDLNQVIKKVEENLDLEIKDKAGQLNTEVLPIVQGHEARIYQTLQNLVSNSLKYMSPNRNPEIRISSDQDQDDWIIKVIDNGKGIPEDRLSDLFKEFTRIDTDQQIPGSGLGLAIVKRHMTAHGGEVHVESQPGIGTTFSLYFPKSFTHLTQRI